MREYYWADRVIKHSFKNIYRVPPVIKKIIMIMINYRHFIIAVFGTI